MTRGELQQASEERLAIATSLRQAENGLLDYGLKYGGAAETVIAYMVQALRFQVTQMGPKL